MSIESVMPCNHLLSYERLKRLINTKILFPYEKAYLCFERERGRARERRGQCYPNSLKNLLEVYKQINPCILWSDSPYLLNSCSVHGSLFQPWYKYSIWEGEGVSFIEFLAELKALGLEPHSLRPRHLRKWGPCMLSKSPCTSLHFPDSRATCEDHVTVWSMMCEQQWPLSFLCKST